MIIEIYLLIHILVGSLLLARYGDWQAGFVITLIVDICFIFWWPVVMAHAAVDSADKR